MKATGGDKRGNAAGLSALREGFAWSPEEDVRFALGFPHVRTVVDSEEGPDASAVRALRMLEQLEAAPRIEWRRGVALGLVRVWGMAAIWEQSVSVRVLRPQVRDVLWPSHPLTKEEAADILGARLERDVPGLTERVMENLVLLVEAFVGSDATAEAIVSHLESFDTDLLLAEWPLPPMITWQLGYLLLRVDVARAEALRARMRRILDAVLDFRPWLRRRGFAAAGSSHAKSLHIVLNGGVAAEDTDRTLRWYTHVTDDPMLIRMRVHLNRLTNIPDARLVFLAGEELLARWSKDRRRLLTDHEQRWFVEQHAPIRSPEMVGILLDMSAESLVREEAFDALTTRRKAVTKLVEEAARGSGTRAFAARDVIERWSEAD